MIDKKCSNLYSRVRWDFFSDLYLKDRWDFFNWLPCFIKNLLTRDTRRWLPSRQITCVQCGEVIDNDSFDIPKLPPQRFTYAKTTLRVTICYRQVKLFSLLLPVWRSESASMRGEVLWSFKNFPVVALVFNRQGEFINTFRKAPRLKLRSLHKPQVRLYRWSGTGPSST